MIKKLIILPLIFFLLVDIVYADESIVEIDFDLNNIAISDDDSPKTNLRAIIPYDEVIEVDNYIDEQTKLGRTLIINWHIINYEPSETIFSEYANGYHLFDITWFRLRTYTEYKDKDGRWTSMISLPTGFNLKPYSEATIHGYGDVPVIISPTICPGNEFCIGGGGEHLGEFEESIVKEIIKENYKIKIIKYPITKSVYLLLNDTELVNKKLELSGKLEIGDSAIVTEISPFYYPFDSYSFDAIYTSYFPAKITLAVENIEDLDLSTSKKIEFSATENEKKEFNIKLLRKDFTNIIWNIISVASVPLAFLVSKRLSKRRSVRWCIYIIAAILIYVFLPSPLNVPQQNLLNISTWIIFGSLIISLEVFSYRKSKQLTKNQISLDAPGGI